MSIPYGALMESMRSRQLQIAQAKMQAEQEKKQKQMQAIQLGLMTVGAIAGGVGLLGTAAVAGGAGVAPVAATGIGSGLGGALTGAGLGSAGGSLLGGAITGLDTGFESGMKGLGLAGDIYEQQERRGMKQKELDAYDRRTKARGGEGWADAKESVRTTAQGDTIYSASGALGSIDAELYKERSQQFVGGGDPTVGINLDGAKSKDPRNVFGHLRDFASKGTPSLDELRGGTTTPGLDGLRGGKSVDTSKMTPKDLEAYEWAIANPQDPLSKKILESLGL